MRGCASVRVAASTAYPSEPERASRRSCLNHNSNAAVACNEAPALALPKEMPYTSAAHAIAFAGRSCAKSRRHVSGRLATWHARTAWVVSWPRWATSAGSVREDGCRSSQKWAGAAACAGPDCTRHAGRVAAWQRGLDTSAWALVTSKFHASAKWTRLQRLQRLQRYNGYNGDSVSAYQQIPRVGKVDRSCLGVWHQRAPLGGQGAPPRSGTTVATQQLGDFG